MVYTHTHTHTHTRRRRHHHHHRRRRHHQDTKRTPRELPQEKNNNIRKNLNKITHWHEHKQNITVNSAIQYDSSKQTSKARSQHTYDAVGENNYNKNMIVNKTTILP